MTDHNYHKHPEYDQLPSVVKGLVSEKEHAWMGEEQRRRLVEDMCNPEIEED